MINISLLAYRVFLAVCVDRQVDLEQNIRGRHTPSLRFYNQRLVRGVHRISTQVRHFHTQIIIKKAINRGGGVPCPNLGLKSL